MGKLTELILKTGKGNGFSYRTVICRGDKGALHHKTALNKTVCYMDKDYNLKSLSLW